MIAYLQVSIKCGRGVEASALRVRFTRMFPVKATQYLKRFNRQISCASSPDLRKIEPAFEVAKAVTRLHPRRGRLHASTVRRRSRMGKRVVERRSLVETVSPM